MMDNRTLISISEASHLLSVSEQALRQWTDEGKVKAFVTPGGHRRYSKSELKRFTSAHQKLLGLKDLAVKLEESAEAHREIGSSFLTSNLQYSKMNEQSQAQLSALGRRILDLIIKYVSVPAKEDETFDEIRAVGATFGETLAGLGLPLIDSVQSFIRHRDPIVNVTMHLMKQREGVDKRIIESVPLVDRAMDAALVALMEAHQRYQGINQNRAGEDKSGDINNKTSVR